MVTYNLDESRIWNLNLQIKNNTKLGDTLIDLPISVVVHLYMGEVLIGQPSFILDNGSQDYFIDFILKAGETVNLPMVIPGYDRANNITIGGPPQMSSPWASIPPENIGNPMDIVVAISWDNPVTAEREIIRLTADASIVTYTPVPPTPPEISVGWDTAPPDFEAISVHRLTVAVRNTSSVSKIYNVIHLSNNQPSASWKGVPIGAGQTANLQWDKVFGPFLLGDVSLTGSIDIGDVTRIERVILGMDPMNDAAYANSDGNIDIGDVTKIERIILGYDPIITMPGIQPGTYTSKVIVTDIVTGQQWEVQGEDVIVAVPVVTFHPGFEVGISVQE